MTSYPTNPSHSQEAVESAKVHQRHCVYGTCRDRSVNADCRMARYLLSASPPVHPTIDEAWAREFVQKCRVQTFHPFYVTQWVTDEDALITELLVKFAGGTEDGKKEEIRKNFNQFMNQNDYY